MSLNFEEVNVLGNILNDGWGYSRDETASAFKVSGKLTSEDNLQITCMIVVNLLNRQEMQSAASQAHDQLDKSCNEFLKQIKSDFKSNAGRALKSKQGGVSRSVELLDMSAYSPKGTALVRCIYNFKVE